MTAPALPAAARRAAAALVLLLACLLAPASGFAQTRAWLDRDRIALGETATLNIETDAAGADAPDLSPLQRDFVVGAQSSRQTFAVVGNAVRSRMLFAAALEPRRQGALSIPALRVGQARTAPLALSVTAAAPSRAGGLVFIETEADHPAPYVQQAVGLVVRLYYAAQLVSGQLDQDAPDGASLQRVGDDVQYTREVGGRRYTVVERRFLLVPERSGPLVLPPARFRGRGVGNFFDSVFGDGQRNLAATGAGSTLDVRPIPAAAARPWLPLRGLSLRYVDPPRQARAGDAVTVVVEATADGANALQLPEITLQAADGAQVFAEPVQADESFVDGRPRVRATRRFSIVPARAGSLRLAGPRIGWWDVDGARAREAVLPPVTLDVAPGAGATLPGAPAPAAADLGAPGAGDAALPGERWIRVPGVQGEVLAWAFAAALFALLWLGTLMWALQRRGGGVADGEASTAPGTTPPRRVRAGTTTAMRTLRHALDAGDLGEVEQALLALSTPPAPDLDALAAQLADPAQRAVLGQLQRARWRGGDVPAARRAVRDAFRPGPRWVAVDAAAPSLLAPLYPR